jgi:hypothetical protein
MLLTFKGVRTFVHLALIIAGRRLGLLELEAEDLMSTFQVSEPHGLLVQIYSLHTVDRNMQDTGKCSSMWSLSVKLEHLKLWCSST